jgi:hypothetical protein
VCRFGIALRSVLVAQSICKYRRDVLTGFLRIFRESLLCVIRALDIGPVELKRRERLAQFIGDRFEEGPTERLVGMTVRHLFPDQPGESVLLSATLVPMARPFHAEGFVQAPGMSGPPFQFQRDIESGGDPLGRRYPVVQAEIRSRQ